MNGMLPSLLVLALAAPAASDADFAALSGRLVAADGTPLPAATVTLLEFRGELTATFGEDPFDDVPAEAMQLVRGETTTAADGRFLLRRADPQRFHALAIDLGRPGAALHLVDVALEPGATAELGDLVRPGGAPLRGRVVDDAGAPVGGARIRALLPLDLPFPGALIQLMVRDHAPGRVLLAGAPGEVFLELPKWTHAIESRLPLPTTESAADGSFAFPALPVGPVVLVVARDGHAGAVSAVLTLESGAAERVVDLLLPRGRTVRGRLLAGERSLAGATVHAGPATDLGEMGPMTWARPLGATGADGRFELSGVPAGASTLVSVQRKAGGPIVVLGPFAGDEFDVAVPPIAPLEIRVLDALGRPRPDAALRFMISAENSAALRGFGLPHDFGALLERGAPGTFILREMPLGSALVLARTDDAGWESGRTTVQAGGGKLELRLPVAAPRRVRVVAARDGAPIAGAQVLAIARTPRELGDPLGFARTAADGRATLETLRHDHALVLRISHPGYCSVVHADPITTVGEELRIELARGGTLSGRLPAEFANSPDDWTVTATWTGPEGPLEDRLPRFAVAGPDGRFHIPVLRPGPWQLAVHPRLSRLAPAQLLAHWRRPPPPVARGSGQVIDESTREALFAAGG